MMYIHIGCDYMHKEEFKNICKEIGAIYDFDTRQKKWEAKLQNNKATKRRVLKLKNFAEKYSFSYREWFAKTDEYRNGAYFKKGKKWEEKKCSIRR